MYNLYPTIGEVNSLRSNYKTDIIFREKREFGECDVEILDDKIESMDYIKGDIARTYIYMDYSYIC